MKPYKVMRQYKLFLLFWVLAAIAGACSDRSQEDEYSELKQHYQLLPFTDIERQTGGLDSLFVVYDSLRKPLEGFIARYAEGDMVSEATSWRNRIQVRKKYWEDIREDFYQRIPSYLRKPSTPEQYCAALKILDTLKNELQYKEPVIMEVLSRDVVVMESTMKERRAELLKSFLDQELKTIKSSMRSGISTYVQQRNRDDQIDGIYEVSSQVYPRNGNLQIDVVYSVSVARRNFLIFKKTEVKQYRATAVLNADCDSPKHVAYSYSAVSR